jgi:hypothetical protein
MTDIWFKPYFPRKAPTWILVGVEARWKTKDARRKVFLHNKGKSCLRVFATFGKPRAERMVAAQHLAEVLNLWITTHSEEELNDLVLLIERGLGATFTPAENVLLGEYLLLGGERF